MGATATETFGDSAKELDAYRRNIQNKPSVIKKTYGPSVKSMDDLSRLGDEEMKQHVLYHGPSDLDKLENNDTQTSK